MSWNVLYRSKAKWFHLVVLALLLTASAACRKTPPPVATPTATIGALLPLGEENGQQAREGIELAVAELNETYAGKIQFKARWEDDRNDPVAAGTRMEALATDSSVLGVVGPINSGPATNAAGVANQRGLLLVSPLASTPALARPNDFFFRTFPSDAAEGRFAADFARHKLNLAKVVVLNVGAPYGQALVQAFSKAFQEMGGTVLDSIEYPGDTQRFGSYVDRVQAKQPEALYYVGYPPDIAEVMRELRSRNVKFPVLSAAIISDPSVATLAGKNVEGVLFPFPGTYQANGGTPAMKSFHEEYRQKFGRDPGFVSAQAYDAATLVGQAIVAARGESTALPSRQAVRGAAERDRQMDGATGSFQLDANGDAIRRYKMFEIKNGAMTEYTGP